MKVLMIEDNPADIAGIIDYCKDQGWEYQNNSFDENLHYIEDYDPDVIVLDLQNGENPIFPGVSIVKNIWEKSFRPVCVFSGQIVNASISREEYPSPLIKFIDKGDEKPVIEYLSRIAPYTKIIKTVQKKMREVYKHSFDVLDYAIQDGIQDENIIAYLCNSRMRDSFSSELQDSALPAWGQYIYPSLSRHLSTGDVVCFKEELNSKPPQERTYFVIMSQSCDIIHKKISHILALKCKSKKTLRDDLCLSSNDQKAREKLHGILNAGYLNNFFILPSFGEILPDLIVDLKDIYTIEYKDLEKYEKIISLSSPYCERLVWAYMQNACRPSVPSLDVQKWSEKLIPNNIGNKNDQG